MDIEFFSSHVPSTLDKHQMNRWVMVGSLENSCEFAVAQGKLRKTHHKYDLKNRLPGARYAAASLPGWEAREGAGDAGSCQGQLFLPVISTPVVLQTEYSFSSRLLCSTFVVCFGFCRHQDLLLLLSSHSDVDRLRRRTG